MANRISTLGYFKKRLRDSGYIVNDLFRGFSDADPRSWSVIIDPGGASIFCTCYQNYEELGNDIFELYDGKQFIPSQIKIKTTSIEVIISYLVNHGINQKAEGYDKSRKTINKKHI